MYVNVQTVPLAPFASGNFPMSFNVRSGEAAEFNRQADALPVAIKHVNQVLRESFDESAAYVAAGTEISQILARIQRLINRLK